MDDDEIIRDGTAPHMTVPLAPDDHKHPPSGASNVIYLALILVPLVMGAAVILIRTGVISGRTDTARTPWDLSVIFLGIVGALVMTLYAARRAPRLLARSRADASDSALSLWEFAALSVAAPLSCVVAVLAFLAWAGVAPFLPLPADPMAPLVVSASALLLATAPMAYFDY